MALYRFKAISERGQVITGTKEAETEEDIIKMLKNSQYYPISIEAIIQHNNVNLFMQKVTKRDIAVLCRQFSTMLSAGISIVSCLDILAKQMENKTLKKAIFEVYQDVQKGQTLSLAMKKHEKVFPILLINMVEVGEISGNLDLLTKRMASYFENQSKIQNKIKNALIYPTVLSIVTLLVVIFLFTMVMPTFVEMFKSNQLLLPFSTRLMLVISNWVINYWHIFFIFSIVLIGSIKYFAKTDKGILLIDSLIIKIPIIKRLAINTIISKFSRIMSILLSSGMPLFQAMDVAIKVVDNKVVSNKLKEIKEDIRIGKTLSEAIKNADIFHAMVYSMIKVGEESGALDELLYKIADYYDNEIEYTMERITALIEPILIIFIAIIIGFIVVSITMPIFDTINNIQI